MNGLRCLFLPAALLLAATGLPAFGGDASGASSERELAADMASGPSAPNIIPGNRIVSAYISQDFLNEQLALHAKSELIKNLVIKLDPEHDHILMRGVIHIPVEELRAINLDPKLGRFRFQVSLRLATTKKGHLIIEFPLDETYFYPADSKDPRHDRVIVPVQMLSLALASARGYLAALSGDFQGFDRKEQKLKALAESLDHAIATAKNADLLDELRTQRESIRIQLEAMPIERKQLQTASKEVAHILGFTGEKELSLNDELAARKNALVLKIKLSQLVPFLQGVDLGGVRIVHDKKDGNGENYFVVDVSSQLAVNQPDTRVTPRDRPGARIAPSLILRLNQSLFESEAIIAAEKEKMGSLRNFEITLKDDGVHVTGSYHTFLFFSVPFETVVDFVGTGTDTFEVRLRKMDVAGIDVDFLDKFVLESIEKRLSQSLKGICQFEYLGTEKDKSRALKVTVDPAKLVPAFPDLHLVAVDMREREFLLKVGRPDTEATTEAKADPAR